MSAGMIESGSGEAAAQSTGVFRPRADSVKIEAIGPGCSDTAAVGIPSDSPPGAWPKL
jgi:hypothetical protein